MSNGAKPPAVLAPVFGVFAVVGWFALIGLHYVWHYTLGWVFRTLADLLDAISFPTGIFGRIHPFGTVSAWLRSLDRNIDHQLVTSANDLEHAAVWLFSRFAAFVRSVAGDIAGLAVDVEHALGKVIHVIAPRLIRHALAFVWRELRSLGRYARKLIPLLLKYIHAIERQLKRDVAAFWKRLVSFAKLEKWVLGKLLGFIHSAAKRLLALERRFVPKHLRKWLAALFPIFGIAWLLAHSWKRIGESLVRWSYDHVTAFIRYFEHLASPKDVDWLVKETEKLVPIVMHEINFILSLAEPERIAPGPIDQPPNG